MGYVPLLDVIAERFKGILRENLIGIYIHGSIAFQCFNWDNSDIDFIVVVDKGLSQSDKLQLLKVLGALRHEAPARGFEMSVVLKKYCMDFIYPTPYELHFSDSCMDIYQTDPLQLCDDKTKVDYDLAAHFTVIKHVGIALSGQPIISVFGDILHEYYLDSIRSDIKNATIDVIDNPAYVILNLCRVYAYILNNLILSKEQGAEWGMSHLPQQYTPLIKACLDYYHFGTPIDADPQQAASFCAYMLEQ